MSEYTGQQFVGIELHRRRSVLVRTTGSGVALVVGLAPASYPGSVAGDEITVRLRAAVKKLPLAAETRAGYDRDKFEHWVDATGDGQDTHDEVLEAESLVPAGDCDVTEGVWRSYYDGATTEDPSTFDIDHLVALAEARDSRAKQGPGHPQALRQRPRRPPLTGRGERLCPPQRGRPRPAEWMPQLAECKYLRHWVAVKLR